MIFTTTFLTVAEFSVITTGTMTAVAPAVSGSGPAAAWRQVPATTLITIFVAATHLPIQSLNTDICSTRQTRPLYTAFRFLTAFEHRWDRGLSLQDWLSDLTMSATALNLHACIAIGMALALCIRYWTSAMALAIQ